MDMYEYRKFVNKKGIYFSIEELEEMAQKRGYELTVNDLIKILDLKECSMDEIIEASDMQNTLKLLRYKNNMTQEDVAKKLHIRQNTYSRYENGIRQIPYDLYIKALGLYGYKISVEKKD